MLNDELKLLIRLPLSQVKVFRTTLLQQGPANAGIPGLQPGTVETLFPETTLLWSGPVHDWLVLQPTNLGAKNRWDEAHNQAKSLRAANPEAAANVYVEPNTRHERRTGPSTTDAEDEEMQVAKGEPPSGPPYPPSSGWISAYPPNAGATFSPGWHLEHAKFLQAWTQTQGDGATIAHLDIGWCREHYSVPLNIHEELGWNFVDGNKDTQDPGKGPNAGHGAATIALLAGNKVSLHGQTTTTPNCKDYSGFIGGAPRAAVIPVRIAGVDGSVIYLYGETMAKGLAYALTANHGKPCDVVSLSHGGLPTKAWAQATNALYEAGTLVVAASGDSFWAVFTDIATHYTVYPSAFYRVVTATGVTFDNGAYKRNKVGVMQGCWGPDAVMRKATSAYTPNVPWMTAETKHGWTMDGQGTSASTPQIAAACALWMAYRGKSYPEGWQRVQACRRALEVSAADKNEDFSEIGLGRLDVENLLSQDTDDIVKADYTSEDPNRQLQHIGEDEVSWPFFRLLFGWAPPGGGIRKPSPGLEAQVGKQPDGIEQMYEVEALQLLYKTHNRAFLDFIEQTQSMAVARPGDKQALKDFLVAEPDISNALRNFLMSN
ncbi:S8/S53 family peptidase [Paraburkholderia phenazinium]|uniref:Subtilase family protein n=1 Tax=Paraburkholderia phenazinium TaxID=60549 RepID=A0A1N6ECE9_9BURK|nr:S8/S53 family peptidase [Paraburkholderia phenazinium]SIN80709.1 Subtilase family protein [Paraburkholderia phenazinium]